MKQGVYIGIKVEAGVGVVPQAEVTRQVELEVEVQELEVDVDVEVDVEVRT